MAVSKAAAMSCAVSLQGLLQEAAAAECPEGSPEELRCLPEAQTLAVVEALHQGDHTSPLSLQ